MNAADRAVADLVTSEGQPAIVTTDELANLVGLTARHIQTLTREGVLDAVSRGRYDQREAVRAYCDNLRRKASGRGTSNPDLAAEKLRLTKMQADKAEMANAAARRELIPAREVESEWASVFREVRSSMLALPSRIQQRLGHLNTHDLSTIDREIRDALTEASHVE